jgi:hypothetical protein
VYHASVRLERPNPSRTEAWYTCRIQPSPTTPHAVEESIHQDELQPATPQAGCAYYVGQLVHATRPDGATVLARVREYQLVGYQLGYQCEVINLARVSV